MSDLNLVSHNAFWFQGMPFEGTDPAGPNPEVLAALAKVYRALDPAILCLQEVQSEGTFSKTAKALDLGGVYCPGMAYRQYGGATLFKTGRLAGRSADADLPVDRYWMKIEWRCAPWGRFVVANVHLPSGRQSTKEEAVQRRLAELRGMLDTPPRPDVAAGDFNERPDGPSHRFMEERGYRDAALLKGAGETGTGTLDGGKRVDYIWLDERLAQRLSRYQVVPAERLALGGGRFLSDHLPLAVTLE